MPSPAKHAKLTGLDYAVMIGGPALFLLIAILGIRALLGGPAPIDPIRALRDGAVVEGMTEYQVTNKVGQPKATVANINGTESFRYERGSWDTTRQTFIEEDAYVDFNDSGRVSAVSFESRTPPPPK